MVIKRIILNVFLASLLMGGCINKPDRVAHTSLQEHTLGKPVLIEHAHPPDKLPQIKTVKEIKLAAFPPPQPLSGQLLQLSMPSVNHIAIDNKSIYWTDYEHHEQLFRYPLTGGQAESVATSRFSGGDLTILQPIRSGDWLLFLDAQYNAMATPFLLRALNLKSGIDQTVLDNIDGQFSLPFVNAEEDRVVWTTSIAANEPGCTYTLLVLYDLVTQQQHELDRTCMENNYRWEFPDISNNHVVAEQDLPDVKGGGNNIYLYDLTTKEWGALTSDGRSSIPYISENWVVWKNSPRFESPKTSSLFNLTTGEQIIVDLGLNGPNIADGHWVYWELEYGSAIYTYNLNTKKLYLINYPNADERLWSVIVHDNQIAWWRELTTNDNNLDGRIEWHTLP